MDNGKKLSLLNRLAPVQILSGGFALLILIGALLLTLPVSSIEGRETPFLTALFTSTSAVCVTGLVLVDTGTYWSSFGQIVIIILIQMGGLGFVSFATLISFILGRKITLRHRLVMQEALNTFSIQGLAKLAQYVLFGTFALEGLGALLLSIKFIPVYGLSKGIYYSIFHAISAYCNAGFDLIGNFTSLVPFQESLVVNLTVMALIVVGGLGFIVHSEIFNCRDYKKISLHSKVVILASIVLIILGAVIFYILEAGNPDTMGPMSLKGKVLASLFASITPRTAGYNTIDLAGMTTASKFVTVILMYIGAAPGSTGGGIKITTAALLFMTVVSVIKGRDETEIMEKRISRDIVYRALSIALISMSLIFLDILILSITEKGAQVIEIIYEAASAFGTVGLSLGLTPKLSTVGKIIILITMYAGRVGPLTLTLALAQRQIRCSKALKYPEDKMLIG